jgi:ribosomal-protein-alanine N-acetyltransferase
MVDIVDIQIERLRSIDIPDVLDIAKECGLSWWSREDYLKELERTDSISLRAGDLSNPCFGFIVGRRLISVDPEGRFDSEIYNIAVRPTWQRHGVGSLLMKHFLDRARGHDVGVVYLEVRDSNSQARQFYRSHGFAEIGKRRGFYRAPEEDAILMSCRIDNSLSLAPSNFA